MLQFSRNYKLSERQFHHETFTHDIHTVDVPVLQQATLAHTNGSAPLNLLVVQSFPDL
jgi:hypothetical protein